MQRTEDGECREQKMANREQKMKRIENEENRE